MHRIFFLIPFLLFFFSCFSYGQDSSRTAFPITYSISEKDFDKGNYSVIDTALGLYHYYLPGFSHNYKSLGNTGSPGQTMFYEKPSVTGFNVGINFMDAYSSGKEQIRYFDTRKPYSKVFFLIGPKEEQVLNARHTQNIGRQFNFGFEYTNIASTGFYQRQKTKLNDFLYHSHFETKNKFYGNLANFIFDKMDIEENGGLDDDAFFERFAGERKDAMTMKLFNASNLYKKKSFYVKQYLNFGKRENIFDAKDSVYRRVISPVIRVAHTFAFEKQIFMYKDESPDSIYYLPLFSYDPNRNPTTGIKDSLNTKIYENTFSLSTVDFTDISGKHFGFKNVFSSIFVKHQNIERLTHNDIFDSTFQNILAGGNLNFRFLKMFSAGGNAVQVMQGFNKSDNNFSGFLEFSPFSHRKDTGSGKVQAPVHHLRFESFHQIKHQDWIYTHYFSDQLQWQYDFLNSSYSGQSLSYGYAKWNISAGFSQNFVKNPVFLEYDDVYTIDTVFAGRRIIPRQQKGRVGINQAYVSKQFNLWKFHLKTNIYYQESSNEVVFPLPELITYNSLFFESFMLRKSIYGQIGVDFYYHTGYYANAYSPFLKQFYYEGENQVGNYPFFDFFINFRIKTVRAFFKVSHVNSGFMGNTYYLIPHYPLANRAFRLGIDWTFLD